MESPRYNDSQNVSSAPKQSSNLYVLPSSFDNGSAETTGHRNNPSVDSYNFFRNADAEMSCNEEKDLRMSEEKQSGGEEKQEFEEKKEMLNTIAKLRKNFKSAVEQVHYLQYHVTRLEQEKMNLEKDLKNEMKKNANSEEERRRQKQHTVPVLQNEDKQEELRIYQLKDSSERECDFYAARRQRATVKKMERNLRKKHPKAALIANMKVPNSVNTFNFVVENAKGIVRNVNYFACAGDTSEVCKKFDKQLMSAYGKRLKKHQNGDLYKYFKVLTKEEKEKVKNSTMPSPVIKNEMILPNSQNIPTNLIRNKKLKTETAEE